MNTLIENAAGVAEVHAPQPALLTARAAAEHIGISKARVYELIQRRAIPYYRVGRLIRLRTADVDAYLEANRVERIEQVPRYGRYPTL